MMVAVDTPDFPVPGMPVLEAALIYLARGFRPIPTGTRKNPLPDEWPLIQATEQTLREWWKKWPKAGVGLVMGGTARLVCLDVDPKHDGPASLRRLEEEHGSLPPTLRSRTPSGGEHLIFTAGDDINLDDVSNNCSGKLAPGIDIRADHAQILVAPSARPDGVYSWVDVRDPARLPPWLVTLLPRRNSEAPTIVAPIDADARLIARARAYLEKCDPAISGQHGHNQTFLVAQHLVRGFRLDDASAMSVFSEWNNRCDPPWSEKELARKLREAREKGTEVEEGVHLKDDRPARAAAPMRDDVPPIGDDDLAPVLSIVRGGRSAVEPPSTTDDTPPGDTPPSGAGSGGREFGVHVIHNGSLETAIRIISENNRAEVPGSLSYNEMSGEIILDDGTPRALTDGDVITVRFNIERWWQGGSTKRGGTTGLKIAERDIRAAIEYVARRKTFHPLRDYLNGLVWDGILRLEHVPEDLLGTSRSPIRSTVCRRWFISAVARALEPGCKADTVLILAGPQGAFKSTFFEILAGQWFGDTAFDPKNKHAFMTLRQTWIYEMQELESLRRASETTAIKSFLSSRKDRYVEPYGRSAVEVPRGFVIVGTTNEDEFLSDDTGNRRIWPVDVDRVDVAATRAQRDQLWAEAVAAYKAGEPWWLTASEEIEMLAAHEHHETSDPWEDLVEAWVSNPANREDGTVSSAEVLHGAIHKDTGQWGRSDLLRVSSILRRLKWRPCAKKSGQSRRWRAPAA